jgi:hypothetical protein
MAMYQDRNRKRKPAMTHDIVMEMLKADMPDDVIRLLIGLDWLTSQDSKMPIQPEKVLDLHTSGAGIQTIRVMLASEIAAVTEKLRKKEADLEKSGWNAIEENDAPREPGMVQKQEMPLLPDPQAEIGPVRLGRQTITRPDGKQVIVYRNPFEDHSTMLGRQVYTKPDGKQTIIYRSPFDEPDPARLGRVIVNRPDGRQVIVYTSASPPKKKKAAASKAETKFGLEEIFDKLRLNIDLEPYLPK